MSLFISNPMVNVIYISLILLLLILFFGIIFIVFVDFSLKPIFIFIGICLIVFAFLFIFGFVMSSPQIDHNQQVLRSIKQSTNTKINRYKSQIYSLKRESLLINNQLQGSIATNKVSKIKEFTKEYEAIQSKITQLRNRIVEQHRFYQNSIREEQKVDWFNQDVLKTDHKHKDREFNI